MHKRGRESRRRAHRRWRSVGGAGFWRGAKLGRPVARSPVGDDAPAVAQRREVAEAVQTGLAELRAASNCSGGAPMPANRGRTGGELGSMASARGGSGFARPAAVLRRRAGRVGTRLGAFYRGGSLGVHGTDAEEKGAAARRKPCPPWTLGSWDLGPDGLSRAGSWPGRRVGILGWGGPGCGGLKSTGTES
jgi:hypothetical protein